MDTGQAEELIQKYKDGKCTPEERAIFESWYNQQSASNPVPEHQTQHDVLFSRFVDALPEVHSQKPRLSISVYEKWSIMVAAAIAIIVLSVYLFRPDRQIHAAKPEIAADFQPGKNAATLILANGKKIYISDVPSGKLAEISGVVIAKTADGQIRYEVKGNENGAVEMNTLLTRNGEQIQIILPDRSKVFLNAGSRLRYPSRFSKSGSRYVELLGEAYFEITKDKAHPFVVKAKDQTIAVLGTQFNVSAFPDERIVRTALVEGAVKINDRQLMIPGQVALNDGGKIVVVTGDVARETAWIRNDFHFDNEPAESVMQKISRWYDISVTYTDDQVKYIPLSGYVSRTRTMGTVLERISKAAKIKFVISGRNVSVQATSKSK